jgi:hypothetical protein
MIVHNPGNINIPLYSGTESWTTLIITTMISTTTRAIRNQTLACGTRGCRGGRQGRQEKVFGIRILRIARIKNLMA